jgi:hypothetical protein
MKILFTLSILLAVLTLKATEQQPDLLIYKSDTIYIDKFPLDLLAEMDSIIANKLIDSNCISSDCWRQYIATWKIENDSLFLIGLKDCCNFNPIPLKNVFSKNDIKDKKVFANWYTDNITAGFGKNLGFLEVEWRYKFEKQIVMIIDKGRIMKLSISTEKQ